VKGIVRLAGASLLLIAVALGLAACQIGPLDIVRGSGNVQTETRTVRNFSKVELRDQGTLVIEQGATEALTIEAEDNLLPLLTSTVDNGTLVLDEQDNTILRPKKEIRYRLSVKDLREIQVSGSGNVEVAKLQADQLVLDISGSGNLTIGQLTASSLTVDLSGSGDADIAGTVTDQQVEISGSSDYRAENLASKTATVKVSGSGNARVHVAETLKARVSGSGDIEYLGTPKLDSDASGSGDIRHVDER
jgi:Putative auto-transporter adhesin, head GIN domain